MRLQREAVLIPTHMPPPYAGWIGRCRGALTRAVALGQVPDSTDVPFESRMLVAQYAGVREIATALNDHDGYVERTTIGTLDRFRAMGASEDAVAHAAARAATAIRETGLAGADRIGRRYLGSVVTACTR